MENNTVKKAEKAYRLAFDFDQRYGECSQATLHALQVAYNTQNRDMFRAIGGLAGGGAARCDGSCGAYSAAIFFMGLFTGRNPEDLDSNAHDPCAHEKRDMLFGLIDKLHQKFIATYGSIICTNIHNKLYGRPYFLRDSDDVQKFLDNGGHTKSGGPGVCGNAAKWTVEILQDFSARQEL
ncbi:MAG: C-GCAxxG-C-C family protein [Actinomycetota bacterium]